MAKVLVLFLLTSVICAIAESCTIKFSYGEEAQSKKPVYYNKPDVGAKTKLEKMILGKLEEFKGKMTAPQPDAKLPTLDPFKPTDFKLDIHKTNLIELTGKMSQVTLRGLSKFEIRRLKLYIVQTKGIINFELPQLQITSNYDLKSNISVINIPAYGKGNVTLTLHNVTLEASPQFHIVDKHLAVRTLNLDWNPAAWLEVSVDGLYCTSSELSTVLGRIFSDLTPRLLRNYKPILLKYADHLLFDAINSLLAKLSLKDILGLIP